MLTSNLAENLMRRTLLPVKLQHDEGKFRGIIIFTRSCNILPFDDDLVQKVKKVRQRSTSHSSKIWYGEYLCKVTTWCMQFLRSYRVHKATWPWASLKVWICHTKVNIELIQDFDVENTSFTLQLDRTIYEKRVTQRSTSTLAEILMSRTSLPVHLQHNSGKFSGIIIFTRSWKMLPFEHDLVQKVKTVRQRSTSNSSEILMWRISL